MTHRPRGSSTLLALSLVGAVGAAAIVLAPRRGRMTGSAALPGLTARGAGPEVERSLTIEKTEPEALAARWRDPETLRRVMAAYAEVEPLGPDRTRWRAPGLGEWTMRRAEAPLGSETVDRWTAEEPDAPLKALDVRVATARRSGDSVVTLHLSVDPPGGALGRSLARLSGDLLPGAVATKALHFFKALVQAGEIPTTKGQPAARRVEH